MKQEEKSIWTRSLPTGLGGATGILMYFVMQDPEWLNTGTMLLLWGGLFGVLTVLSAFVLFLGSLGKKKKK